MDINISRARQFRFLSAVLCGVLLLAPSAQCRPVRPPATRREYTRRVHTHLNSLSAGITRLSAEKSVGDAARSLALRNLRAKLRHAESRVRDFEATPEGDWQKQRVPVDAALVDLQKSYNKFLNRFH